jgi:hypothetical protein
VGVNVTVIAQLVAAANAARQLLVWAKSPLEAIPNPEKVNGPVPVLLRNTSWPPLVVLTNCGWKATDAGEMPATGAVPVPVKGIVCVPVKALSVIVTVPGSGPVTRGA